MKFQLVESFDKIRYTYNGPVYSDNGLITEKTSKTTYANSKNEAIRNIKYQLYQEFGIRIDIDAARIKTEEKPKPAEKVYTPELRDGAQQISMF